MVYWKCSQIVKTGLGNDRIYAVQEFGEDAARTLSIRQSIINRYSIHTQELSEKKRFNVAINIQHNGPFIQTSTPKDLESAL